MKPWEGSQRHYHITRFLPRSVVRGNNSYASSINPLDSSDYLRGATVALAVSGGSGSLSVGFSTEKLQGYGADEYFHGLSWQFSGEDESTDIDLPGNFAAVRITYNKDTGLLSAFYD